MRKNCLPIGRFTSQFLLYKPTLLSSYNRCVTPSHFLHLPLFLLSSTSPTGFRVLKFQVSIRRSSVTKETSLLVPSRRQSLFLCLICNARQTWKFPFFLFMFFWFIEGHIYVKRIIHGYPRSHFHSPQNMLREWAFSLYFSQWNVIFFVIFSIGMEMASYIIFL